MTTMHNYDKLKQLGFDFNGDNELQVSDLSNECVGAIRAVLGYEDAQMLRIENMHMWLIERILFSINDSSWYELFDENTSETTLMLMYVNCDWRSWTAEQICLHPNLSKHYMGKHRSHENPIALGIVQRPDATRPALDAYATHCLPIINLLTALHKKTTKNTLTMLATTHPLELVRLSAIGNPNAPKSLWKATAGDETAINVARELNSDDYTLAEKYEALNSAVVTYNPASEKKSFPETLSHDEATRVQAMMKPLKDWKDLITK